MSRACIHQGGRPIHELWAGREVDALIPVVVGGILVVFDWPIDVDDDPAHGVDGLFKPTEIDARVVLRLDAEVGAERLLRQFWTANSVGEVNPLLAAATAHRGGAAWNADPQITRDRHQRR